MRNIGLIIQGPLVSRGISGRTAHIIERSKLREGDIVSYDCRENIQNIIDRFGHLFSGVVISTWEDEVKPSDSWKGAALVTANDKGLKGESLQGILPNNKFKQFFGVLSGIKYLEQHSDVDFIIKMRTDQWLDISKILESVEHYLESGRYTPEVIFVPRMKKGGFGDFYFAGNIRTLKSFHRSFLEFNKFEFHSSVHKETWLKYAYVRYRDVIRTSEHGYFSRPPAGRYYCKHSLKIFEFMVQNVFRPLSFSCYRTIVWRGEQLSKKGLQKVKEQEIFEEDFLKNKKVSSFFPKECACTPAIDWRRYEDFRCNILGEPALIKNWIRQQLAVFFSPLWYIKWIVFYSLSHPSLFFRRLKKGF